VAGSEPIRGRHHSREAEIYDSLPGGAAEVRIVACVLVSSGPLTGAVFDRFPGNRYGGTWR
jgi:hypothetical protein